jgi:uncharacterized phage-associated protein
LTEAANQHTNVTQYDIIKSLFLADRAHLNRYGRPITYDNYVAMKYGPVPSLAYDLLKDDPDGKLPWKKRAAPEIGDTCYIYEKPTRAQNEDVLSESDCGELRAALTVIKALGFHQIRKLTHEDHAYVDAWEDEGERQQFPMSYALFFDVPNDEGAKDLAFLSKHLACLRSET